MTSKAVALRLPDRLIQAIELKAKATGRDKTQLVVEVLMQAFDSTSLSSTRYMATAKNSRLLD
jgi:predicted DNA-binding protein